MIKRVPSEALSAYAALTYPYYGARLKDEDAPRIFIAMGATWREKPVGLALAVRDAILPEAQLLSLYVAPPLRRQHIGTALLSALEQELRSEAIPEATAIFVTETASTAIADRILTKQEWGPPHVRFHICKAPTDLMMRAPWFDATLPPEFEFFPWAELKDSERAYLTAPDPSYPTELDPFSWPQFEPINSLGLRYEGRVIGWMITHRTGPEQIDYDSLYVFPPHLSLGRAIPLLAEAIKRQARAGIPSGRWIVEGSNAQMIRFMKRRFAPLGLTWQESHERRKTL